MLSKPSRTNFSKKIYRFIAGSGALPIGVFMVISSASYAGEMGTTRHDMDHFFGITGYVGGTTSTINPSNLLFSLETDSLVRNNKNLTDVSGGGGVAYYFVPPAILQPNTVFHDISVGVDVWYFQTRQTGQLWQFEDPQFNNFSYALPIQSTRVLFDSEWTFNPFFKVIYPFIEGGVGFVSNTTSFSESPLVADVGTGFSLNGNTQYNFTYTLGAGIKAPLPHDFLFSMRYLYADLGRVDTTYPASTGMVAPVSASFYTQAWLAGLTYLF